MRGAWLAGVCVQLLVLFLPGGASRRRAPQLPPRRRDQRPEGTSLRQLIFDNSLHDPFNPQDWEIYYDTQSGLPYYYSK
jgi:hypothetical protein